jgi:hypothetical protein
LFADLTDLFHLPLSEVAYVEFIKLYLLWWEWLMDLPRGKKFSVTKAYAFSCNLDIQLLCIKLSLGYGNPAISMAFTSRQAQH